VQSRGFDLPFEGDLTGISDMEASSQRSTLNSQLSGWYTLDGRCLNGTPSKSGIYVKNGKKIVMK
jgi:hypothetical protein